MKKSLSIFVAAAAFASFAFMPPAKTEPKKFRVVIDAGHGGKDHGAVIDSYSEKEIVREISKKIKDLNSDPNVDIMLIRSDDSSIALRERTETINNIAPDLVVSLHLNAEPSTEKSGMDFYVANENAQKDESSRIASVFYNNFKKASGIKVNEIQQGPFAILKKSKSPAVLLELGYLTNPTDRMFLTNDFQQTKIAKTILETISALE